jgi:type I restriction enzyme S subunit
VTTLPPGWAPASIASIAEPPEYGLTAKAGYDVAGPKYLRITDIQNDDVDWSDVPHCLCKDASRYALRIGDLLFARTGATTGKSYLIRELDEPTVFASYLIRVRPKPICDPKFLENFFRSQNYWDQISAASSGTAQPGVNATKFVDLKLPLPPLLEQRRIVAKLDALQQRSKRARAEVDCIPQLITRAKAAILEAAFGSRGAPVGRISDLVNSIDAGKNLRCEERPPTSQENGVVKVSAVTWGEFDPSASKTLPIDFDPPERSRIRPGDLLISRANTLELVGACVIVRCDPCNLYLSDKVLRLNAHEEDKTWLLWFFRSPFGRRALERASSGNQMSMRNISQAKMLEIEISLPPREARLRLVRTIEAEFAKFDRLAAEARSAASLLDRLDQAILAKAFRGELVPQDPNDEPASALLDRIRAERAAELKPKTRRVRLRA